VDLLAISLLWGIAAAGLAIYALAIGREISYVTLADGRRRERRLPLLFRLLLPWTALLRRWTEAPELRGWRDRTQIQLVQAGFDGIVSAAEFIALRLLAPGVLGSLGALLVFLLAAAMPPDAAFARQRGLIALVLFLGTGALPGLWLSARIRERHLGLQRALPFVMDLLTLSVEAGTDFMSALQRIIDRRPLDPMSEELIRVLREIQLGKTRREALRDMARRIDQPDIRSVLQALVQADELGVGIGQILRIQSAQIRNKRFERAEKLANEAPVKLLFPLIAFIFPAVFLILLGPILVSMVRSF